MKQKISKLKLTLALLVATLFGTANMQAVSYNLWICGKQVTDANKDNLTVVTGTNGCTVTGTVKYNPANTTLTLNGAGITIPNGANAIRSAIEGLIIDVTGNNSVNSDGWATMRFEKSATIKGGGTLSVSQTSAGWALFTYGNTLSIENCTVNVTSNGRGITSNNDNDNISKLTIKNAAVTATGTGDGSITHFADITLDNSVITLPTGAVISQGSDTFFAVRDAAGNIIKEQVKIEPATPYNLWIWGTQVTSANCGNLGAVAGVTQGTITYDNSTKTLTLNNVKLDKTGDKNIIKSSIDGLIIEVVGENSLKANAYSLIDLNSNSTIQGSGTLNVENSRDDFGVNVDGNSITLTIKDCILNVISPKAGIRGTGNESIVFNNATVSAKGTSTGSITGFNNVSFDNCFISKPDGAVFNPTQKAVCYANGTIVKEEALIEPGVPATLYNLWICGKQVTSANKDDLTVINGYDGCTVSGGVSYNPDTRTLTLNGATINRTSNNTIVCHDGGVNIELIGDNTVTSSDNAIVFNNLHGQTPCSIYGSGTLNATSTNGVAIFSLVPLTIKNCTVNAVSGYYGLMSNNQKLTIHGATVSATGTNYGSIIGFSELSLIGCVISKPAGAEFNATQKAVCYKNTDNIVKETVKIEPKSSCITFSSASAFKVTPSEVLWDGQLYYSTNKTDWAPFTGTGATAADNGSGEFQLHIRGTNNTYIISGYNKPGWVIDAAGEVACSGSFEALLDYTKVDAGQQPEMEVYCFGNLFKDCAALVSTPPLTATKLSTGCYSGMFQNCTGLKTAPALPATKMYDFCYDGMFRSCTSLTQAPELPADTLSNYCYQNMFEGCTSLTQAPVLPVRTLAGSCYAGMFKGCTSLTQAPVLPADTLDSSCYDSMFKGCTSLTQPPVLPATTLEGRCYCSMFEDCISLTQAPELPALTMTGSCYEQMFDSCIVLTTAPVLPATTLAYSCYGYMFKNCKALTQAPELKATTLDVYSYSGMFENCTSLTTPPALPADTLGWACYAEMFKGCTGLTQAPELPATKLIGWCYESMFKNCTSLTMPPALPAESLAQSCYREMFKGCTGLTRLPELPATNLVGWCYNSMFENCTGITLHENGTGQTWGIPDGAEATGATNWNTNMFAGTGGTFTGNPEIGADYYYTQSPAYLTFSSANAFTITPSAVSWDGELFYSTDTTNWNEFTRAGATAVNNGTGTYTLHFRGKNNTRISGGNLAYWIIDADAASVACSGNIETLLDYTKVEAGEHPTMAAICFANLFRNCTALSSAPELAATNLSDNCYTGMFRGCTGLTAAPALPATTLTGGCYQEMFKGCTSLVQAPELKAMTLPSSCYKSMFMDCTALKTAPELPATTLGATCYQYMFSNCASLTKAPTLQAMTMSTGCYYSMFDSCTSLKAPPKLPAKTLAPYCYYQMFIGCTSIKLNTEVPGIAWSIPADADATSATGWNTNMFAETGGSFTGAPEIGTTYYLPAYDLWICGEQVTAANMDDLSVIAGVTGTVNYNPDTGTLRLENADITADNIAIKSEINGLIISIVGNNSVTRGVSGDAIQFSGNTTITGGGALSVNSHSTVAIYTLYELTIKDCTVTAMSRGTGIDGEGPNAVLTINNATVSATGTNFGSILNITELNLIGCIISKPAGAAFNPDKLAVCYADGNVVKEEVLIVPTGPGTGVDKVNAQAVTLYPNPIRDILHIQAEKPVTAVRIYNVNGTAVTQAAGENISEIDLTRLPAGIYMVRVETGESVSTMRIVKK